MFLWRENRGIVRRASRNQRQTKYHIAEDGTPTGVMFSDNKDGFFNMVKDAIDKRDNQAHKVRVIVYNLADKKVVEGYGVPSKNIKVMTDLGLSPQGQTIEEVYIYMPDTGGIGELESTIFPGRIGMPAFYYNRYMGTAVGRAKQFLNIFTGQTSSWSYDHKSEPVAKASLVPQYLDDTTNHEKAKERLKKTYVEVANNNPLYGNAAQRQKARNAKSPTTTTSMEKQQQETIKMAEEKVRQEQKAKQEAKAVVADDLKQIDGITLFIETQLNKLGIRTFEDLMNAEVDFIASELGIKESSAEAIIYRAKVKYDVQQAAKGQQQSDDQGKPEEQGNSDQGLDQDAKNNTTKSEPTKEQKEDDGVNEEANRIAKANALIHAHFNSLPLTIDGKTVDKLIGLTLKVRDVLGDNIVFYDAELESKSGTLYIASGFVSKDGSLVHSKITEVEIYTEPEGANTKFEDPAGEYGVNKDTDGGGVKHDPELQVRFKKDSAGNATTMIDNVVYNGIMYQSGMKLNIKIADKDVRGNVREENG